MKLFTCFVLPFYEGKGKNDSSCYSPKSILTRQTLMRIQVVIFLMLFSALHINAKVFAQKITLNLKQQPLEKAFLEIEKATGMAFFGPASLIEKSKPVTIQLTAVSLDEALKAIFKDQPLTYEIIGKMIKIMEKPVVTPIKTPPIKVRGKVTDINNNPLPAVSIRVRGTNVGTVTDQNGDYTIDAEPDAVLVFTSVGFQAMQIKVNGQPEHNLTMIENEAQLSETVIKGYYQTTKELNTGNVSTIKAEDIARQPVTNFMAAIVSKVPGLFVQQANGVPGRQFTVRIRGQNSIENGNEPLFIVDGVQYNSNPLNVNSANILTAGGVASPFNYLNPADIESIEVLKDADATAIYGSRGANGVILINTKKSKDGKLQLDARYYTGFSEAPLRLKFMNTQQYLAMRRQAFDNDKKSPGPADYDLNGTWDTTRYTDWQKYLIGNKAPVHDANIGLSMGNLSTSFRIGAGYRNEGTIYPGSYSSERAGLNFSANHSALKNRFNLSFSASYNLSENNLPISESEQYVALAPNAPNPFNPDGTLNWANGTWTNPMTPFKRNALEKAMNMISNLTVSYKFYNSLTFKTSIGYTASNFKQQNITPYSSISPTTPGTPASLRVHMKGDNEVKTLVIEPQVSYSLRKPAGDIDFLVGATIQGSEGEALSFNGLGFSSDAIMKNMQAATTFYGFTRSKTEYRYSALFARVGYNYQRKYVLNLTARRDASSRFGPGKRVGNFGAIGAAWIFSNEDFLKKSSKFLSLGKIRASIGSTGNDQLGEYKYLDTYSASNFMYQGNASFIPTQLTNPFYGWERVNKVEIGLELGFWNGRIDLIASIYRNRTRNQLVQVPLPTTTGFGFVRANLPAVIQNSGIEIDFRSVNIENTKFSWSTSFNITVPRNKLVKFPNIKSSSYATRYIVGRPINRLLFAYEYIGNDPANGLFNFKDVNGDGSFTSSQDFVPFYVGQDFYGGIGNNFRFGSLEFDFQLQFTRQNGLGYLSTGAAGSFGATRGNQLAKIEDLAHQMFTQSNSTASQRSGTFGSSSGILTDASFIRLRNAGIYYNIPVLKKIFKQSKIYVQGQNLALISSYTGFDPESPASSIIVPQLRTIVAGLNLTL